MSKKFNQSVQASAAAEKKKNDEIQRELRAVNAELAELMR